MGSYLTPSKRISRVERNTINNLPFFYFYLSWFRKPLNILECSFCLFGQLVVNVLLLHKLFGILLKKDSETFGSDEWIEIDNKYEISSRRPLSHLHLPPLSQSITLDPTLPHLILVN